jgi:peptidoglycan/LPS O-acetylase OafA/YrhL
MPIAAVCVETASSQAESATRTSRLPASSLRAQPAENYLFADNIRFLSIAAIVLLHCVQVSCALAGLPSGSLPALCFLQPFKFATIGFFLISGFLMGHGLRKRTPREYLRRRLQRVCAPWLFWVSLYCAMVFVQLSGQGQFHSGSLRSNIFQVISVLYSCVFQTPYWFVPNLMIAVFLLLHWRRHLLDLRLGCVLMGLSLFYGLNMYAHWFPNEDHTEAMFGFIFYLWLGVWAERHFATLQTVMARIPATVLFCLAGLIGLVALFESRGLSNAGDPYAMSSLRISNQAYSMVAVLALFKLRKPAWPKALNVRATTFGIYLTHTIVLILLMSAAAQMVSRGVAVSIAGSKVLTATVLSLACFLLVYGGSLALTEGVLRSPRLRWTIGAPRAAARRAEVPDSRDSYRFPAQFPNFSSRSANQQPDSGASPSSPLQ